MNALPAQPNHSLINGIAVLQELAARGRPVSGLELAGALGLEKTRVNRLLKTLAWLGMTRVAPGRKYVAGDGMHILAAQSLYASGLLRLAIPRLEKLHATGGIVAMGVLWRDRVSYFYHHQPGTDTLAGLGALGFYPAGASSIGMALLAQQPEADVAALFGDRGIAGFTGTRRQLLAALAVIRQRGFADLRTGERSLAVSLNDHTAIALSGRFSDTRAAKLVPLLRDTAARINEDLHAHQQASG
ncbi:MAG: helix-turn-helix domain-containing protein [Lentisphaeria bacterium]